ncbi:MAG: protein-methionine-sulfoxide reductase heme-binding subunit MsrQ [Pseudomonadota bacterium]
MTRKRELALKVVLHLACLTPCAVLVFGAFNDTLGANPVEYMTHETGQWALRLLLLTLLITPLRRWTGWAWLVRQRRMIGLYGFFYAMLHLTVYAWFDQFFDVDAILEDIVKRPYITIGFSALVLLVPLAATSTNGMIRRLGGKRWKALHRLAYVAAVLGVGHFIWLVKADYREPIIYATFLVAVLLARVPLRRLLDRLAAPTLKSRSG